VKDVIEHEVREERGKLVIALRGDVDLGNSPAARRVLLECVERGRAVLVDLSGVSYIDSSGIASLVEALQNARQQGSGFALACVSPSARRVLELARLDQVFQIHTSVEEGLAHDG
jgi:anti-sigma B factor antagonist